MKHAIALAAFSLLAAVAARADIVEWQDGNGNRHFTNIRAEVPNSHQVRVVVTEPPATTAPPAPAVAAPAAPRQAQVVYDYSRITDAYAEGFERGLSLARGGEGGAVQINGPLAIANARGGFASVPWLYSPFVTTSFDRGRSRHLTLRMLLQDQFQLDRDGPFLHERLPTGLGVALQPFLPRGLPHGVPPGARVLFR